MRRGRGKPSCLSLCTAWLCCSRKPHIAALWAVMVQAWERSQGFLWSKYLFWHWPPPCGLRVITPVFHFSFPSCDKEDKALASSVQPYFPVTNNPFNETEISGIYITIHFWNKQTKKPPSQWLNPKVWRFSGFHSSLLFFIPFFTLSNEKMRKRKEGEN